MRSLHPYVVVVSALFVFATSALATPRHRPLREKCSAAPTPDGYIKTMTFYSDGTAPDLNSVLLDPTEFWEALGRDDDFIADQRSDAIDFYMSKFGVDAEQLVADGRAILFPFLVNPEGNYRAVSVSGEAVGDEGWRLYDTGWQLMITDPDGVMLGGAMPMMAPLGSFMMYGEYFLYPTDVPRDCPRNYRPEPIHIQYSSGCPVIPDAMNFFFFICDISHPEWGEGKAGGGQFGHVEADGSLTFNTRNVVTFPAERMEAVRPHRPGRGR